MTDVCFDQVNAIIRGDIVGATPVRAGNMNLVVLWIQRCVFVSLVVVDIERAQIFEFAFPKYTTGIHVTGAQAIHALNEQPAAYHLLWRTMTVAWQDIHVATAAEPQHTQRQFDTAIVRLDRVGNVAVLMRPISRTRQRADSAYDHAIVADFDGCLLQVH